MIALPAQLPAQRMSCTFADSVLRSDQRGYKEGMEAIGRLLHCPEHGASAFTALLRRSRWSSLDDTLARQGTWYLFDSLLVDSIAVLSKDARQSRQRRAAYLALLTRYADCHVYFNMDAIDRRGGSVTGSAFDACGGDDRHPLPSADRERARAAIAWMSQHDPDELLRQLAAVVSDEMTFRWIERLQTPSRPR